MDSEQWDKFASTIDFTISTLLQGILYNISFNFTYRDLNKLWTIIRKSIIKSAVIIIPFHQTTNNKSSVS